MGPSLSPALAASVVAPGRVMVLPMMRTTRAMMVVAASAAGGAHCLLPEPCGCLRVLGGHEGASLFM
jgi:hypothetical protein